MIAAPASFAMHALGCSEDVTEPSGRLICAKHDRAWTAEGCPAAFELADLIEARDTDWKHAAASVTADTVLMDVVAERLRQDEKWGMQNHDPAVWLAILTEEVGELAEAILFDHTGGDQRNHTHSTGMRAEAVQVAAVAVHLVQYLDRRADRLEQDEVLS